MIDTYIDDAYACNSDSLIATYKVYCVGNSKTVELVFHCYLHCVVC